MHGEPIHGERIVDGDASTLTALTLFADGHVSTNTRTLAADEWLVITDIIIALETAGDYSLVADSAAAGRYIAHGSMLAQTHLTIHLRTPYTCPMGVVPKFSGPASNRSSCIIQGSIQSA